MCFPPRPDPLVEIAPAPDVLTDLNPNRVLGADLTVPSKVVPAVHLLDPREFERGRFTRPPNRLEDDRQHLVVVTPHDHRVANHDALRSWHRNVLNNGRIADMTGPIISLCRHLTHHTFDHQCH